MKANNGSGDVPERDLWRTEQKFWDNLNKQYNFGFDCCADKVNTKCHSWTNEFESEFELKEWNIMCWMNPPFSKAKEMFKHFFEEVSKGVAIYRFDNAETSIWQEIIFPNATWIFIPKGRISYTPFDITIINGAGTRFPSVLIGLNVDPPKELEGTLIKVFK